MTKCNLELPNYKSNCKVIGNSITVTVIDPALPIAKGGDEEVLQTLSDELKDT